MSQGSKIAVLGLLLVVIFGVAGWRIRSAMKDGRGPQGRHESNEEWLEHLKDVSIDSPARAPLIDARPAAVHSIDAMGASHVAKLRWRDLVKRLDHFGDKDQMPFPVFNRAIALGGNFVVPGAISDEGPDLEPGQGWLDLDVYFVRAGSIPYKTVASHSLCVVSTVLKESPFKVGDLLVAAGETDLRTDPAGNCVSLSNSMRRFQNGQPFAVTVVRGGQEQVVTKSNSDSHEIMFTGVPVLDSDLAK